MIPQTLPKKVLGSLGNILVWENHIIEIMGFAINVREVMTPSPSIQLIYICSGLGKRSKKHQVIHVVETKIICDVS